MSGRVKLEVVTGPMQGKEFVFEEHDTLLFGRMPDCHVCLPNDPAVSRHHFILEANPPDANIRDLGSLNGTYVNGIKYGSREKDETPEEGANRKYPEVDLKSGDQIEVGNSVLKVCIEGPAVCCRCDKSIADKNRQQCAWLGGTYICPKCKEDFIASGQSPKAPEPVRCQKCGKDVSNEVGKARRGDYVCNSCRVKVEADPAELLKQLLRQAAKGQGAVDAPKILGYDIKSKLGAGAFGAVYLAQRKKDNKKVAIKVMLSKVAVDEHSRKMFLREIDVMKGLRHEYIVPLLDHGSAGSAFYFIMELCDGGSVDKLLERRADRLNLSEAGHIMLKALEGLAYAHSKGFVHRDIKPSNILLTGTKNQWDAKISDFGLAKNFEKAGLSGMSITGSYAGTPVFMPREQVTNYKHVKPVSDVWSMGATFYNMLTGQFPRDFRRGQDPVEAILRGSIIPIRKRDSSVPRKVAEVIDRAISNDVKERYQTAGEMKKALARAI